MGGSQYYWETKQAFDKNIRILQVKKIADRTYNVFFLMSFKGIKESQTI